MDTPWVISCIECRRSFSPTDVRYRCTCGGTLDVQHDFSAISHKITTEMFDMRLSSKKPIDKSGVWRFKELVLPIDESFIATRFEGNTGLYTHSSLDSYMGLTNVKLKHEGENPTGSFKDRGMTVAISIAKLLGKDKVACASTGNTSASMASYAAYMGMSAYVFVPKGQISYAKLSQSIAFGAKTLQIEGDFDIAMDIVQKVCDLEGIYLVNSINPYRIEGQKSIAYELLQDLSWVVPDWVVVPGGNLGNSAALYKAFSELHALQLITRIPRILVVQAAGANPLFTAFKSQRPLQPLYSPQTLATAIKIGNPVSWKKSLRGVIASGGLVEQVSDQEIMDAKAHVDAAGIGAEPASCATVAGVKKLTEQGIISRDASVCLVLTGHILKDSDSVVLYHKGELSGIQGRYAQRPALVSADVDSIIKQIRN